MNYSKSVEGFYEEWDNSPSDNEVGLLGNLLESCSHHWIFKDQTEKTPWYKASKHRYFRVCEKCNTYSQYSEYHEWLYEQGIVMM